MRNAVHPCANKLGYSAQAGCKRYAVEPGPVKDEVTLSVQPVKRLANCLSDCLQLRAWIGE